MVSWIFFSSTERGQLLKYVHTHFRVDREGSFWLSFLRATRNDRKSQIMQINPKKGEEIETPIKKKI